MGWLTWHIHVSTVLSIGAFVTLPLTAELPSYCSNSNVSCSSQLFHLNVPDSACSVIAPQSPSDCAKWRFNMDGVSPEMGSVALKVFPKKVRVMELPVFNVTFTDIKWTSLRLRFSQDGYDKRHFCREFHVSSDCYILELFYDCQWTQSEYQGTPFTFEYEAASMHHTETRRYVTKLPFYENIELNTPLKNWTPLLYVDTTELPFLTARWQQVPSRFGVQNYSVKVFKKVEGSEMSLEVSEVVRGTDDNHELSYNFDSFPVSGVYHFEVGVLNDSCPNGLCGVSSSPDIPLRDYGTKTLMFGIVGCVIFIVVCLLTMWIWQRHFQPVREDFKLPVVLIMYTPSRAAHIKCMVTLTEYLRNHCFVEALLDQLDILYTEKQDPFVWCNEAFSRADFVMVVSSPPKCCNQEGIFRNLDVLALRFLKERFSKPSSRPQFFSVLMPYCTEKDIPDEAKNLKQFTLMKDFDKMLWYIHNGGRFHNVVDYARSLLDPKQVGGKSYWQERGNALQAALREAEDDLYQVCNCKKQNIKQSGDDVENAVCLTKLMTSGEEGKECGRNIFNSVSTDHLLVIPEALDVELPFSLDDLDLTGAGDLDVKPKEKAAAFDLGFDLGVMKL